ncbi:winged helix-turn-helix transcriptional regulator [Haloplanus salilacus]|uniref:winged helix-turn-helix transcriptional regulator n=1 Tax=Haloplanus salilacus TaxID=2949994 RepID=UPI0030D07624
MTRHRDRIRRHVASNPGVHFNRLARDLDLATGQVQHHLKTLRRADDLIAEPRYGRTHYYTPEYGPWERGALAVIRRETARDVLVHLIEHGPSAPGSVASALDVARSTLEWHLDHLTEQDLVEKRRDDGGRVTLALTRPEGTARLLGLVEPSLPERLVDRFTRLVDGHADE